MKYVDPDGRKIYISENDDEKYNKARYALKQLQNTPRGNELGHAEQDLDGNLKSKKDLLNSDMTSNEIAKSRGEAIRTDYSNPLIMKREILNVE